MKASSSTPLPTSTSKPKNILSSYPKELIKPIIIFAFLRSALVTIANLAIIRFRNHNLLSFHPWDFKIFGYNFYLPFVPQGAGEFLLSRISHIFIAVIISQVVLYYYYSHLNKNICHNKQKPINEKHSLKKISLILIPTIFTLIITDMIRDFCTEIDKNLGQITKLSTLLSQAFIFVVIVRFSILSIRGVLKMMDEPFKTSIRQEICTNEKKSPKKHNKLKSIFIRMVNSAILLVPPTIFLTVLEYLIKEKFIANLSLSISIQGSTMMLLSNINNRIIMIILYKFINDAINRFFINSDEEIKFYEYNKNASFSFQAIAEIFGLSVVSGLLIGIMNGINTSISSRNQNINNFYMIAVFFSLHFICISILYTIEIHMLYKKEPPIQNIELENIQTNPADNKLQEIV